MLDIKGKTRDSFMEQEVFSEQLSLRRANNNQEDKKLRRQVFETCFAAFCFPQCR